MILFAVSAADAAGTWSDWTTDTSKLSDSKYEYQSKAQYSTRTKQTTTSTSSSLSGWTRDDSKTTYTINWGETVWYDNALSTSETFRFMGTKQVAAGTQYYLYRYYSPTYNSFATYQKDSTYVEDGYWVSSYYSYDPYHTGQALYQSDEIPGSKYPCWLGSTRTIYKTQYGYQSGTKVYTYSFYQYSAWSDWQDGSATASDTVRTRTLYRYRLKNTESTPTASLTAKDNLSAKQTVTVKVADEIGLQGFFFGTNSDYKKNEFTQLSNQTGYSKELTVSEAGTYYLVAINNQDRVSAAAKVTFYKISLNGNGGTLSSSSLILASGHTVKLPTPSKNKCTFLGWSIDRDAASGAKSVKISGNTTYYAIWGNVSAADWSQASQFKFSNSSSNFTTGIYTVKDRDLETLNAYIRKYYSYDYANRLINYITEQRLSTWGGSCYGMSLAAILDYTGQIGMNENFGNHVSTVHDISAPYMNADGQSAINYYFLTQFIPEISNAYLWVKNTESNWTMALSSLVSKVKNGELVSFLYFTPKFGHSIVLKAYGGTDSSGNYVLKAYDNRYPNQDIKVVISSDYKTCTVNGSESAYMVAYLSAYDIYDKYDIDGADNDMKITKKSVSGQTVTGTTITVSTAKNITIRNSDGKTIVIKNGKVASSSTAKILSMHMSVMSTADGTQVAPLAVIRVNNSDYFSFESGSGTIEATVSNKNYYTSVSATDASSAVVSDADGVYINGDHAKYTVTRSVEESDFDMFSFTGTVNGSANVDYENGKVYATGNVAGASSVTKYSGTKCEVMEFTSTKKGVAVTMVTDYCSSHTYRYKVIKKATTTQTGEAYRYCTRCGHKENSKTVAKISSAKLSGTSYTYNGKVKTPTVTIKDSKGNTLKKDTDYTVSYASGRKLPGTYTVTVTYKGRYSGTKKLTFTIKVKAASISSATAGSGKVTLKWSSVSNVTGYEVWYAKGDGSFKKAGTTTGTSYTKKSLTNGKTYKFKIRSYVTISGKKYYSAYSAVKSTKVK